MTTRTKIISAFPGVGKTTFYKANRGRVLDSDSSMFSWVIVDGEKKRNPDFPRNYIEHIQENIGKVDYILVSSHKEVREALQNACLFFHLIYPAMNRKNEFIQRYKDRGSPESFIKLLDANWANWISACVDTRYGCNNVTMTLPNLADEIEFMEA